MSRRLGTCGVCFRTEVEISTCISTGTSYCRNERSCKRGAGVNVNGTGLGAKRRKPRAASSGDAQADGGSADGGGDISLESSLVLIRPYQIIGHRLGSFEHLHQLDARRGEALQRTDYRIEYYVRGIFTRSPNDPGICDTFWRSQRELVELARTNRDEFGTVVGLIRAYSTAMRSQGRSMMSLQALRRRPGGGSCGHSRGSRERGGG